MKREWGSRVSLEPCPPTRSPQITRGVRRTTAAAPTCVCCPRGSPSTPAPAPRAYSFRTTGRRARRVSCGGAAAAWVSTVCFPRGGAHAVRAPSRWDWVRAGLCCPTGAPGLPSVRAGRARWAETLSAEHPACLCDHTLKAGRC